MVLLLISNYFYTQTDEIETDTNGFVYEVNNLHNGQFLKEFIHIDPFPSKLPVSIKTQNHIEYS